MADLSSATEAETAAGAFFAPKVAGEWQQANIVYVGKAMLTLAQLTQTADGMSLQPLANEHLACESTQDGLVSTAEQQYIQPRAVTAVDLNHWGGDELCTLCTRHTADGPQGDFLFCHFNRNETPTVAAASAAPTDDATVPAKDAASVGTSAAVVITYGGDDPSDDQLTYEVQLIDAGGRNVTQPLLEAGQLHLEAGKITFHMAAPAPTSWDWWLLPTAYAETAPIVFPLSAVITACDPGQACASATVVIESTGKAAVTTPPAESPGLTAVVEQPIVEATPPTEGLAPPQEPKAATEPPPSVAKESAESPRIPSFEMIGGCTLVW